MEDSVFTKIIKGEIPCHKIYEDEKTLAFLDIHPLAAGHTLVVPKVQVDNFDDLLPSDYQAVFKTVKKVSKRLKEILQVERTVILILGYDVPHAHVHLIPGNTAQEFYTTITNIQQIEAIDPDHAALAQIAARLAF